MTGIFPSQDQGGLSTKGRIKSFVHGWKQAFIAKDDACTACGLCVQSCPEKAITLGRIAKFNKELS
jgi:ferredoxin